MQNKKKLVSAITLMACSGMVHAVLPDNAILKFDPGVAGGAYDFILSGSYFAMDTNGDGNFQKNERTGIAQNVGLTVNKSQLASGSHSGAPDDTESPGIDNPWNFFGNTGLHQTTSPSTILSSAGNTATLDFSGWSVTWNGIADIPMGAGADNGVATVTCAVDCAEDDTYVIDYLATVPLNDPSGFGGVPYALHLEGTVSVPSRLTVDSGTFAPGLIAQAVGSADGRISMEDLLNNGGVADPDFTYGGGLIDFVVTGITGTTVTAVIPQTAPIPADAVYRKFIIDNNTWITFIDDGINKVASAQAVAGTCPVVNDAAYNHANGLVEGDDCVQLVILDGGPYDADSTANNIADPGGVATPVQIQVDTRTSGTSGCSMTGSSSTAKEHADWWLVAAFIGLLGWFKIKRERSSLKS